MDPKLLCFLIDNDEDDREIFVEAVATFDSSVICMTAESGLDAIQKFSSDKSIIPSVIFIDMNMPLMNGKRCLSTIRSMNHLAEVPIYMYSTAVDPISTEEVKKGGARDIVVKPASFNDLVTLLGGIIQSLKS